VILEGKMSILSVVGLAIIAAAFAVLLRQRNPEYAMLIGLGAGVIILIYVIMKAQPVFSELNSLMASSGIKSEYAQILIKALGICFITQLAADVCKDSGETAIASKVELFGKFAILLIALPLFEQVAKLAMGLLSN
jgi:stage III sporulation protein AD